MLSSKSSSLQLSSQPSHLRTPQSLTKTPSTKSSRSSSNAPSKKLSKKPSFFKKIRSEWSGLLYRLKDISKEALSEDEEVADLFEDSGAFDLERLSKIGRPLTDAEEQFLRDYKKYRDLDKIFEMHQLESGTARNSEQDIDDIDRIMFKDLDMTKLKENLVASVRASSQSASDSSGDTQTGSAEQASNLGEILWEYRRVKWLSYGRVSEKEINDRVNERREETSIKHIPKELYPRIYTNLVDKGKTLKDDKRLNLEDLLEVVNEGWKKEERWTRAAEGLP